MESKTNIIFILIDDLGWRDLSCYGSEFYETPNIDKLASEGMVFTNAYAASPVCSPSRASIMTGKYPARVGVTDWIGAHTRGKLVDAPYLRHLPLEEKSFAKVLRENGYCTWHVGKWHLGEREFYPEKHGFDVNIGGCHLGHPKYGYFSPYKIENLSDGPDGEYLTDRLTDEAIKIIGNRDKDIPFFLNLWHYTVHTPIEAKEEDINYFKEKARNLGLDNKEDIILGEFFPCEHKKHMKVTRRIIQSDPKYAAMIYNLDWNIGRLIEYLSAENILDDTLIIFTSDNGGLATAEGAPTCNYPLSEGKGWMYDGGVREPLIAYWKNKINPKSKCNKLVSSPDFYPTILDVARVNKIPKQHIDGESFYNSLIGIDEDREKPLFWHYPHYGNQGGTPYSAIRQGDYKLIYFYEYDDFKLYNLKEDIGEKLDISKTNNHICYELLSLLHQWLNNVNAYIPEKNVLELV